MGLRISNRRTSVIKPLGAFFATLALLLQPLVALDIPAAFAASVTDRVVINEIMANPGTGNIEWVELYNPTNAAISLDGWRIRNSESNFSGIFHAGSTISAGGFLTRDASNTTSQLNNTSATLLLQNTVQATIDTVSYSGITAMKSYARSYDASDSFTAQATPTKNSSNGSAPVDAPQLTAPTIVSPANGTTTSSKAITFSWNPVSGATSYEAEIGSDGGAKGADVGNVTEATFDVIDDGTYYFKVRAVGANGNYSPYSESRTITVATPTPEQNTVCASGCEYTTIQGAINGEAAGSTITVKSGTYNESINVNKQLVLNAQDATITGSITVSADDVTVNGFTINDAGIGAATFANNTTFSNNRIVYQPGAYSGIGANSNPGTNLKFINNVFTGNGANIDADIVIIGQAGKTGDVAVTGNTSDSGATLVALFNTAGATISNNSTSGALGSAIYVGGGNSNITISKNTITNAKTGINIANDFGNGPNSNVVSKDNSITNTQAAAKVGATAYSGAVDMTKNWWGDASGPKDTVSGDGSTPDTNNGNGTVIMNAVNYSNWCVNAACSASSSNVLPAPVIVSPANGAFTTNPNFTNVWQKVDGAAKYQYETTYGNGQYYTDNGVYDQSGTNVVRQNNGSPEATYTWRVRAISFDGTNGQWSAYRTVTVDSVKPGVSFISPSENVLLSGTISVNVNANDVNGIAAYCLKVDGGSCVPNGYASQPANGAMPMFSVDTKNYTDGTHTLIARVVDKAGNVTEVSRVIRVDNTSPVLSTNIADGDVLSGTKTLTLGLIEQNPKIYNIRVLDQNGQPVNLNGMNLGIYNPDSTLLNVEYVLDTTKLADGVYKLQFSVRDAAGNPATIFRTVTVANPPVAPTDLVWKNSAGMSTTMTNDQNGSLSWTASTSNDVDRYVYKYWNDIPSSPYKESSPYVVEVQGTTQAGVFNQGQGTHFFCVAAKDITGNESACSPTYSVVYNSTAPTLNVVSPTDGQRVNGTITVTANGSDDSGKLSGYQVFIGSQLISDQQNLGTSQLQDVSIDTTDLSDGSYVIRVELTDEAGNKTIVTRTILIDNTAPDAPTVTSTTSDPTPTVSGSTEPGAKVTLAIGSKVYSAFANAQGLWSFELDELLPGTYLANVLAADSLGNVGAAREFNVIVNAIGSGSTLPPLTASMGTPAQLSTLSTVSTATTVGTSRATGSVASGSSDAQNSNISEQNGDVLGTKSNAGEDIPAAIKPSAEGWQLFGLVWYWWLIIIAAITAVAYALIRRFRPTAQ